MKVINQFIEMVEPQDDLALLTQENKENRNDEEEEQSSSSKSAWSESVQILHSMYVMEDDD